MEAMSGIVAATAAVTQNPFHSSHHPGSSSSTSSSSSSSGYGSGHSSASTPVTPMTNQYDAVTSTATGNSSQQVAAAATIATVSPYYSEATALTQRQPYFAGYASYAAAAVPQQFSHVYDAYNTSLSDNASSYHNLSSRATLDYRSSGSNNKHHSNTASHHINNAEKSSKMNEVKNTNSSIGTSCSGVGGTGIASTKPQATATPFYAQPLPTLHTSSSVNAAAAYFDAYKLPNASKLPDYSNYGTHFQHAYQQQQQQHYYAAKSQLHDGTGYGAAGIIKPLSGSSTRPQQPSSNSSYAAAASTGVGNVHHSGYNGASSAYYDKYMYGTTAAAFYGAPQAQQHVVPAPTHTSSVPSSHGYHYDSGATDPYHKSSSANAWHWNSLDYRNLAPPANSSSYLTPTASNMRDPFGIDKYAAAAAAKYDKYSAYPYAHPTHAQQYMSPSAAAAAAAAAAVTHNLWSSTATTPPHLAPGLGERLQHPTHAYASAASASAAVARQNCCNPAAFQQSSCHYGRGTSSGNTATYMPHATPHQGQQYSTQPQHQLTSQQSKYAGYPITASASGYGRNLKSPNNLFVTSPFDSPPAPSAVAHPPYNYASASTGSTAAAHPAAHHQSSRYNSSTDAVGDAALTAAAIYNDLNLSTAYDGCYSNAALQAAVAAAPPTHMQHLSYGSASTHQAPGYNGSGNAASSSTNSLLDYRKSSSNYHHLNAVRSSLQDLEHHVANTANYPLYDLSAQGEQQQRAENSQQVGAHFDINDMNDCGDKTSPSSTNKNLSVRDFFSTWNEDEEEEYNNAAIELHYVDGQVAIVTANSEPSILLPSDVVKLGEMRSTEGQPASQADQQEAMAAAIQVNSIQPLQQQQQAPQPTATSNIQVGVAVETEADLQAVQYINLPDIVIDTEKSSTAGNVVVPLQQPTTTTETVAKAPVTGTIATKDMFEHFDAEKELDELHIKRARLCLEKQLNNEIQILSPERPNEVDEPANNFSGKLHKTSSQHQGVIKDPSYVNPEHLLKDFEYTDNTSSHSSTGSTFEKEYETFINKIDQDKILTGNFKVSSAQFASTGTIRKSHNSKAKCTESLNDFVCTDDCCAGIMAEQEIAKTSTVSSNKNNCNTNTNDACNDECCASLEVVADLSINTNIASNIGFTDHVVQFESNNGEQQMISSNNAEQTLVQQPGMLIEGCLDNLTAVGDLHTASVIRSTTSYDKPATDSGPICLQADNYNTNSVCDLAPITRETRHDFLQQNLKTDFNMQESASFEVNSEQPTLSTETNEFAHNIDDDSGSTHSSSNTSGGLKTPTELEQEQENAQNMQDFSMFYKKKRKLVQDSKERAAQNQPPNKSPKTSVEVTTKAVVSHETAANSKEAGEEGEVLGPKPIENTEAGQIVPQNGNYKTYVRTNVIKTTRSAMMNNKKGGRKRCFSLFSKILRTLRIRSQSMKVDGRQAALQRYLAKQKERCLPLIKRQSFIKFAAKPFNPRSLKNLAVSAVNTMIRNRSDKLPTELQCFSQRGNDGESLTRAQNTDSRGVENTTIHHEEIHQNVTDKSPDNPPQTNSANNEPTEETTSETNVVGSNNFSENAAEKSPISLDAPTEDHDNTSTADEQNEVPHQSEVSEESDFCKEITNESCHSQHESELCNIQDKTNFHPFKASNAENAVEPTATLTNTTESEETVFMPETAGIQIEDTCISSKGSIEEFKGFDSNSYNDTAAAVIIDNSSSSYKTLSIGSSSPSEADDVQSNRDQETNVNQIQINNKSNECNRNEKDVDSKSKNDDESDGCQSKSSETPNCLTPDPDSLYALDLRSNMAFQHENASHDVLSLADELELPPTPGKNHDNIISNAIPDVEMLDIAADDDDTQSSTNSSSSSSSSSSRTSTSSSNSSSVAAPTTEVKVEVEAEAEAYTRICNKSPTRRMSDASEDSEFNEMQALERELSQHKVNDDWAKIRAKDPEIMEVGLEEAKKTDSYTKQDIANLKKILETGDENDDGIDKIPKSGAEIEQMEIDSSSESEAEDDQKMNGDEEKSNNLMMNDISCVQHKIADECVIVSEKCKNEDPADDDVSMNVRSEMVNEQITVVDSTTGRPIVLSDNESDSSDDDDDDDDNHDGDTVMHAVAICESSSGIVKATEIPSAIIKPTQLNDPNQNQNQNLSNNSANQNINNFTLKSIVEQFLKKHKVFSENDNFNQNSNDKNVAEHSKVFIESVNHEMKQKQRRQNHENEMLNEIQEEQDNVAREANLVIPKLSDLCKIALSLNSSFKQNENNKNTNNNSKNDDDNDNDNDDDIVKENNNNNNNKANGINSDINVNGDDVARLNVENVDKHNDNIDSDKNKVDQQKRNSDVECELTVEQQLAEMYRQVGVTSDDDENHNQFDVIASGNEAQDVLLINLAEILADNNFNSIVDDNIYVLQCDINENILGMVTSTNARNDNHHTNNDADGNDDDNDSVNHATNSPGNSGNNNNSNNSNNCNQNNTNKTDNSNSNRCNDDNNNENSSAIIFGNFLVHSDESSNNIDNHIDNDNNNSDDNELNIGSDNNDTAANINTLQLIQILNANDMELLEKFAYSDETNDEENIKSDGNVRDSTIAVADDVDENDIIASKLKEIHRDLNDDAGDSIVNSNHNDNDNDNDIDNDDGDDVNENSFNHDLPIIHHEEVVPDNYKKYEKEQFLKYLHGKYVQKNITKFYHSRRILKKYRQFLLRKLLNEVNSDKSDTQHNNDSDSDSDSESASESESDSDNDNDNKNDSDGDGDSDDDDACMHTYSGDDECDDNNVNVIANANANENICTSDNKTKICHKNKSDVESGNESENSASSQERHVAKHANKNGDNDVHDIASD